MCVCVLLQETEHPQQVCSNETGDITAKEKSTYAGTHIQLHRFIKKPQCTSPQPQLRFLTSVISSFMATGQNCVFSHLFN